MLYNSLKEAKDSSAKRSLFQDLTPQAVAEDPPQVVTTLVSAYTVNLFVSDSLDSLFSYGLLNCRTRLMLLCLIVQSNQRNYLQQLPQRLLFSCYMFLLTVS